MAPTPTESQTMKYEYIEEAEVEVVKRGRKSTVSPEVVEAIKNIPTGKVVKFTDLALDPTDADYKNAKASVSAMLRQAGAQAGKKVSVRFTPTGIPQVSATKAKTKK